ncbi:hypothetical protein B0H16DRAFT_252274 [Mycena metata]|uniref:Uncharacterized protein n=1 Tax=Mycena metata TaxID=1033252 RepID=A0AAD7HTW6_9AGAR|nr:hypothetical protein B0H16DRAFT_252274 [Mycena metata]
MSRSVVSFLGFLFSLGVEILVLKVQSVSNDHLVRPSSGGFGQNTSNNNSQTSTHANSIANRLNLFQLALFALTIIWSLVYVVMIPIEIRRCMSSHEEVEAGLLGQTDGSGGQNPQ